MENTDKQTKPTEDAISALVDGCLGHDAAGPVLRHLAADATARSDWHAYHLIGDVLRSPEHARSCLKPGFVDRLAERLAQESTPPAPVVVAPPLANAANAEVFRWKLVAGFASLAAVVAVGWNMLPAAAPAATGAVQARIAAPPTVTLVADEMSAQGNAMIRDPQLDALLAAHKQLGGTSALQASTGFLRNATFEGVSR